MHWVTGKVKERAGRHMRRLHPLLLLFMMPLAVTFVPSTAVADEFVGPLAGWVNVGTSYGAKGDGSADDTAARQKRSTNWGAGGGRSLFLPPRTYRITRGLKMASHRDVGILGADSDTTRIQWDGPDGGEMLDGNGVRYSRFARLTWDGAGGPEPRPILTRER